jgi:hypothetical protein
MRSCGTASPQPSLRAPSQRAAGEELRLLQRRWRQPPLQHPRRLRRPRWRRASSHPGVRLVLHLGATSQHRGTFGSLPACAPVVALYAVHSARVSRSSPSSRPISACVSYRSRRISFFLSFSFLSVHRRARPTASPTVAQRRAILHAPRPLRRLRVRHDGPREPLRGGHGQPV